MKMKSVQKIARFFPLLLLLLLTSCSPQVSQTNPIPVEIHVDGEIIETQIIQGQTVRQAITNAKITLQDLDQASSPFFTVITEPTTIQITRVQEKFEVEEQTIPFETQILKNESIPEGEQRLIQAGENGLREDTIRFVYEDGVLTRQTVVKSTILEEALPEIIMVGSKAAYEKMLINGNLAYLTAGNAWIMEESTANRRPLVTTGDLDGRIFKLSPDGNWLLFSRKSDVLEHINALWVINLNEVGSEPIPLNIYDVIWFADWVEGTTNGIVYSTVVPIDAAPGWQANNDLQFTTFSSFGWVDTPDELLPKKSGGLYGWWGTDFLWSPDGEKLAYTRPDGVGIVDFGTKSIIPLMSAIPYQTNAEWAWIPPISWSPDGDFIYTVEHAASEVYLSDEDSPLFNLVAIHLDTGAIMPLASMSGMFAYSASQPDLTAYSLLFMQAQDPMESNDSLYDLYRMDRDGSGLIKIFPGEGAPGLSPQEPILMPIEGQVDANYVALIYRGNLWLVDTDSGRSHQLTGDSFTTEIDWR